MTRDDGCTHDFVGPGSNVNLDKAVSVTIENRAVYMAKRLRKSVDRYPLLCRLFFTQTDMRDLRVRVRTPRNHQGVRFSSAIKKRVLHGDSGIGVGGVR